MVMQRLEVQRISVPCYNGNGTNGDAAVPVVVQEEGQSKRMARAAGSRFRADEDLSRVLSQNDPERMKLTQREHEDAIAIKAAVEAEDELNNLCDLIYAQLAIICKDDLEDVLSRCHAMQHFRQEYKILDTAEEGYRCFSWLTSVCPGYLLNYGLVERDGTHILLQDIEKMDPKAFTSSTAVDAFLKFQYYTYTILAPDLESIRKGHIAAVECEGMGLRRETLKLYSAFYTQYLAYHPFKGECRYFHSGAMCNVMISMLRKLVPHMRNTFRLGFQFDGHLGEALLLPNVEQATERSLGRMEEALRRRYTNEKSFSLTDHVTL